MLGKLAVIASVLVAVTGTVDFTFLNVKEAVTYCAKKHTVKDTSRSLLSKTNDPNALCEKHCIAKRLDFIKENGDLNLVAIDKVPKELNVTSFVRTCAQELTGSDTCQRVHVISVCAWEKAEKLVESYSKACAEETKTKVKSFRHYAKNFLVNMYNPSLNCYVHCMLLKVKAVGTDGNAKLEKVKPFVAGSKYEKLIDQIRTCSIKKKDKNACDKVANRFTCVAQKNYLGSLL